MAANLINTPFHHLLNLHLSSRCENKVPDEKAGTANMSPELRQRRESFADSVANYSPTEASWSYSYHPHEHSFGTHRMPSQMFPLHQDLSTPLSAQSSTFPTPSTSWPVTDSSGSCTPIASQEPMASEYSNVFSQNLVHLPHDGAAGNPFATSTLPSPTRAGKDWSETPDFRSISAHPPLQSPSFVSTSMPRRDGIRKKNARFEIPAERNLKTIDLMINNTSDEHEIKELKQQKRLLRNRQAALDSRQRKKQHTERLEDEKKHYTSVISDLEDNSKAQEADYLQLKEHITMSQRQFSLICEGLVREKEQLLQSHTIETGELRQKNAMLMEQVEKLESTAMSAGPNSAGFSSDFTDFDQLDHRWDDFSTLPDFTEPKPAPESHKAIGIPRKDDDKVPNPAVLLMLLLCGAWVASRSTSHAVSLPSIPDDVRAASVMVLENIYQDSGIELRPTSTNDAGPQNAIHSRNARLLADSSLETLHNQLTAPSSRQLHEQAFAMTASQFNDLSTDSYHTPLPSTSPEASYQTDSTAAAYTRSIMYDKVPKQVLSDFARMVAAMNDGPSWKVEPSA